MFRTKKKGNKDSLLEVTERGIESLNLGPENLSNEKSGKEDQRKPWNSYRQLEVSEEFVKQWDLNRRLEEQDQSLERIFRDFVVKALEELKRGEEQS